MRSWRKEITALLISTFLVVLGFLLGMVSYFNSELTEQLLQKNRSDLAYWTNVTEYRLNSIHNNVHEILLTIYNNATIASGSQALSFEVSKKCQELMEDQLTINPDADCYFVMDSDTGKLLFSSVSRIGGVHVSGLKEYVRDIDYSLAGGINDKSWSVCTIGSSTYFLKLTRMGKYMAGSLCRADTFNTIGNITVFGSDSAVILLSDGSQIYGGGNPRWVGELLFDEKGGPYLESDHLVVMEEFPLLNCSAVFIAPKVLSLETSSGEMVVKILIAIAIFFSLFALITLTIFRRVIAPTRELLKAQEQIGAGNIEYRITTKSGSSEFDTLFKSFNGMANQIKNLRIETYDRLLREQEAKFQMVRAQIKPHFYLNVITVISNMTYQNRLEDIRTYVHALAKHIRYMLNVQSSFISVSEELTHIENYLKIQELRFPGSVSASIDCADEVRNIQIPFLVLFTVVENSFKHALNLYKPMELRITCEPYSESGFDGYRLSVEDNGDGFSERVLSTFLNAAPDAHMPTKDHLGLSNINYTLRYVYKRNDLLRLSNTAQGARTEILIPTEVMGDETPYL